MLSGLATAKWGKHKEKEDSPEVEVIDKPVQVKNGGRNWTISEKTMLFEFILSAEHENNFELVKKNPGRLWKKVCVSVTWQVSHVDTS